MRRYLLFGTFVLSLSPLIGQIGYQLGDSIAPFKLPNINGSDWQFDAQKQGYLIVFMSPNCPFVQMYADRLADLHHRYAPKGYPIVAIHSNHDPSSSQDSLSQLKAYAAEHRFSFAYLWDEQQTVARAFGATRMPQCFLIVKDPTGAYRLRYIGAIDDKAREDNAVKSRYLETALEQLIQQKKINRPYTRAAGCSIKWAQ